MEQLADGVNKTLVVVIAHALDIPVMITYPGIQPLHELAMFISIVYGPGKRYNDIWGGKWKTLRIKSDIADSRNNILQI